MAADRLGQDPGTAAQQGKFDGGAGIQDPGLAGQAIVLTEELLGLGGGRSALPRPGRSARCTRDTLRCGGRRSGPALEGRRRSRKRSCRAPGPACGHRNGAGTWQRNFPRRRDAGAITGSSKESGRGIRSAHGLWRQPRRRLDFPGIPIVQIVASGAERQPFGPGAPGLIAAPEAGGATIPGILVGTPPFGYEVGRFADLPVDLPEAIHAGFEFRLVDRSEVPGHVCSRHWPASVGKPP